jgi:hypothetical protein
MYRDKMGMIRREYKRRAEVAITDREAWRCQAAESHRCKLRIKPGIFCRTSGIDFL